MPPNFTQNGILKNLVRNYHKTKICHANKPVMVAKYEAHSSLFSERNRHRWMSCLILCWMILMIPAPFPVQKRILYRISRIFADEFARCHHRSKKNANQPED
ncbi:uncharacterized protein LOC144428052 [Styela clava]